MIDPKYREIRAVSTRRTRVVLGMRDVGLVVSWLLSTVYSVPDDEAVNVCAHRGRADGETAA